MSDTTCEVYDSQSLFCIQLSISSRDLKITSFSNRHQSDQCFASNISSSPNILKQISITCAQRQFCNRAFQVLKSQCIRCTNGPLSDLWHIASINLAQYHMQGIFENVATMNLFHRTPFTKETIFVSSVRSSNSHPDLLLTHPTFSDHTGPQHWTFWATTAI